MRVSYQWGVAVIVAGPGNAGISISVRARRLRAPKEWSQTSSDVARLRYRRRCHAKADSCAWTIACTAAGRAKDTNSGNARVLRRSVPRDSNRRNSVASCPTAKREVRGSKMVSTVAASVRNGGITGAADPSRRPLRRQDKNSGWIPLAKRRSLRVSITQIEARRVFREYLGRRCIGHRHTLDSRLPDGIDR
jgi:hypothetical protein